MNKYLCAVLFAGASAAATSIPAVAQTTNDESAPVEEVVVTGSRIARTTFETPTPVTSIGEKELKAKAATSVIDLLDDVPALRPNRIAGSGRSIGTSNFNMRSLGASRTLVMLDGQRLMDSSPVGGFDVNVIPAPLLARVDIVTAGASSVYGSDAVTGVVNLVLNNELEGGRVDAQYNVSSHGDKDTRSASVAYGSGFASDRGHMIFAASYVDSPDIFYQGERSWGQQGYTLIPNAAYTPTNGEFRQLIVPNVRLSQMTNGGVITTAGPLKNIQFGANGQQSLFVQGTNVGTVWMQGGDGLMTQPDYGVYIPASEQESVFSRITYELTPEIEARFDLLGTHSKNESTNNFNYNNADIVITRENPYLPANILAGMITNNLQTIRMGRLNPETGLNHNFSTNHYYRAGAGLKGMIFQDWTWDVGASFTYGYAENRGENNRIQANWTRALDVVTGPGGQPVCRSTLTTPDDGCAPANVFGLNTLSAATVDYVTGTSSQRSYSRNTTVSANITGQLFATWAGPISVATGVEYRDEQVESKSDPISDINGWRQGTFASYNGSVNVAEIYGEASLPLARDIAIAKSMDLDLAARHVNYSTSGTADVWKTGLNWSVNDQVRIRSTYSKDFRAPKIDDLFSASSLRAGNSVIDFVTNQTANVNVVTGGNPALKPEIAHTLTAGVVFSPGFAQDLQLSVDYFDIKLEDALTTFTAQEVVNRCGGGDQQFCAGITRNGVGVITTVNTTQFNAQVLKTSGIDLEASYRFGLDAVVSGWRGNLELRTVATHVDHLITSTGGPEIDTAGQLSGNGTPKWRASTTVAYINGPVSIRGLFNYVGKGKYDNTYGPLDINTNEFPAYTYLDLAAQYDIGDGAQLYAKVENVFDKAPPLISNNTITIASAAAQSYYDVLGRLYGLGVRYRW